MSHLIETMAYIGQTPWHQLGHALPQKQPLEVWAQAAGMQWQILETPVRYLAADGMDAASSLYAEPMEYPEQKVLYRSDTKAPLSVVSNRYQVVQPRDVLSSTAISPRSLGMSSKQQAFSRLAVSSGHWPGPASQSLSKAMTRSTAICFWQLPAMVLWQRSPCPLRCVWSATTRWVWPYAMASMPSRYPTAEPLMPEPSNANWV